VRITTLFFLIIFNFIGCNGLLGPSEIKLSGNINNAAADKIAPTVVSVTTNMADGNYNPGTTINVDVVFSEVVLVTGTPKLSLSFIGGNQEAQYVSGSGSTTLRFSYITTASDKTSDLAYSSTNALSLNAGSILDAANNVANLTLPAIASASSLDANHAVRISRDDSFSAALASQWSSVDKDNWDMDGNGNPSDDVATAVSTSAASLQLIGRGADVWNWTHQYVSAYLDNQTGDFDYSIKVISTVNTDGWSKTGFLIANNLTDLTAGGILNCSTTQSNNITVQYANANNGNIDAHSSAGSSARAVWLRLKKVGTVFSCYYKYALGDSWTLHSSPNISSIAATFDVGLITTAHSGSNTMTAILDDFSDLDVP
jgi:hypothetical protein